MDTPFSSNTRNDSVLDLCGKVCPYPVVEVISAVELMKPGQRRIFLVDDPLALKSIPEELEELDCCESIDVNVEKQKKHWCITVTVH